MLFRLLRQRVRFRHLWVPPVVGRLRHLSFRNLPPRRPLRRRRVRPLRHRRKVSPLEVLRLNQVLRRGRLKLLPPGQRAQQQRMARALDQMDLDFLNLP